jgi:hypothetical protein
MTETNHNKRLSEVLSHTKCPRCNSSDKEAIAYFGDNYNLSLHPWCVACCHKDPLSFIGCSTILAPHYSNMEVGFKTCILLYHTLLKDSL